MKTFKEIFEEAYGDDSFNDDFTIDALSAESLAISFALELLRVALRIPMSDFKRSHLVKFITDREKNKPKPPSY